MDFGGAAAQTIGGQRTNFYLHPGQIFVSAESHAVTTILAIGAEQDQLHAKLFGGACVLEAFRNRDNHLGTQNVEVAREILAALDVPIIGEDVEGRNGRKLIFHTDTGSAWIKRL